MNLQERERHFALLEDFQERLGNLEVDIQFLLSLYVCESCEGNGEVQKDDDTWEKCADCGGKGWSK